MDLTTLIVVTLIKLLFVLLFMLLSGAVLTWVERRMSAVLQDRVGPNRVNLGPFRLWGLLQPMADFLKMIVKEDFRPARANRFLFSLAPILALAPVIVTFAVIPFGGDYCAANISHSQAECAPGYWDTLQVADLNVGILFLFAFAGFAVYGPVLGGWASDSRYSMMGSLRATAQMISYEVTLGLTIVGIMMVYGSVQIDEIVRQQSSFTSWGMFTQPLGFLLFLVASIAETRRIPFDVPEGESEIIAGYFMEYSGMKFGMFFLAEFLEIVVGAALLVTLFAGGWHFPGLTEDGAFGPYWLLTLVRVGVFVAKYAFFIWVLMLVRWTLPRFRYDQIMNLGWKVLLPLSLANIAVTAIVLTFME